MLRRKTPPAARQWRAGFTLVELLVVLAIIAILISLTAAAVMRFLTLGPEVQTHSEIGQLETALNAAKNDLRPGTQLEFLPSVLVLREDCAYGTTPIELASVAFLQKAFGKRIPTTPAQLTAAGLTFIDWNGDGTFTSGPLVLDGGQCLVFWLGGIPNNNPTPTVLSCGGFSTNPLNPADTANRKAPYFDFKPNRLVAGPGSFYYYNDPFKLTPYAYFTSYPISPFYAGAITATTATSPINITSIGHGLSTGQQVRISGVSGNPAANGTWAITFVDANNFTLNGSSSAVASAAGGTWNQVGYHESPSDCNLNGSSPFGTALSGYAFTGLLPYQISATQWINANGYQIISAGKDGTFGLVNPGLSVYWNPATGWPAGTPGGADDIANFSKSVLGAPQNN
jgi:prepilin-type N-terminal cleavage/methylation domain-containing protein